MSIMRIALGSVGRRFCVAYLLTFFAVHASQVKLVWDPSPDADTPGSLAGYRVRYSQQDFSVPGILAPVIMTNDVVGNQTNLVITNLSAGLTYYFSVTALGFAGAESDPTTLLALKVPISQIPQLPPMPDGSTTTSDSSGGSTSTGSSTTGSSASNPVSSATEVSLLGMVPRLWLYPTNGQAMLAIQGTVGATFTIQSSPDPGDVSSWTTITNITLSMPAPNVAPAGDSTLEKAFVPALQSFQDPAAIDGAFRCYRIYMPLGFPILADQVLAQKGFTPRLIAVRCPGLSGYVVCYVTEEAAYLDYNDKTYIVKLVSSGPSIREVATIVAANLGQNWTTASEFTVAADGTKSILATVVQTDDPLLDPPIGVPYVPSVGIVIDF